jgi:hypothetical protein
MCSYILYLTTAIDGYEWLTKRPGSFNPRNNPVTVVL